MVGDDKKEITGHKVVFVIQSKVFAKMFKKDFKEKKCNRVQIPDIKSTVFEVFTKFLYTQEVDSLSEFDEELLIVAKKVCFHFYLQIF